MRCTGRLNANSPRPSTQSHKDEQRSTTLLCCFFRSSHLLALRRPVCRLRRLRWSLHLRLPLSRFALESSCRFPSPRSVSPFRISQCVSLARRACVICCRLLALCTRSSVVFSLGASFSSCSLPRMCACLQMHVSARLTRARFIHARAHAVSARGVFSFNARSCDFGRRHSARRCSEHRARIEPPTRRS